MAVDAVIFGLIVADLIAATVDLRHPPDPGGLAPLDSLRLMPGGNACNVSLAMARLGARVAAAGIVGNDALGQAVREKLRDAAVDVSAVEVRSDAQTSATVVAVEPGGERVFFHAPGATKLLNADAFTKCFELFAQARVIQIGYFGLLPALTPALPELLKQFKILAPEVQIALDTAHPPAATELLWPILPYIDIFCPSRREAIALTGQRDPKQIITLIRRHMPDGLIGLKLDIDGAMLDFDGQQLHLPAYPVQVIDTTGAGDCWFAGLLAGLLREMPLEMAGRLANRIAADCCTQLGAGAGVRSLEQTLERII